MISKKGRFLSFEGIDGSGKSTQVTLLKNRIFAKTAEICYDTYEPSTGPIGSLLRQFLSGRMKTDERALAALFASDRLDHLCNDFDGILNKIHEGTHVLCDRYILSNYAYQGTSTSLKWVMELNARANELLKPDCHIFIDIEPKTALERISKGRIGKEIYETEEKLTKVRTCYFSIIDQLKDTENILVIDGNKTPSEISEEIWNHVSDLF